MLVVDIFGGNALASQSLYRKWRSRNFAEIVGQQHVTRTLRNALVQGRMSHAYVFSGPRGIGKTSAARVLAKAANCENPSDGDPCCACPACISIGEGRCLDVIEIDAASNRSIDDIRDLRDKINFAPSEVRFKFYILDEVHMLSNEAFNALLKTLEEPPPHAVFVLVTTESHKLPATVLSRCQRFDFRRIALPDLVQRLDHVSNAEGIQIEPAALELVGRLSTGSLRDAESLLDQLVSYCGNTITLEDVHMVVGMTGSEAGKSLVEHFVEGNLPSGLKLINDVAAGGADLRQFGREVVDCLRKVMLAKVGGVDAGLAEMSRESLEDIKRLGERVTAERVIRGIRLFSAVENSQRMQVHSQLPLELAFVEAVLQPGTARDAAEAVPSPMRAAPSAPAPVSAVPVKKSEPGVAPSAARGDPPGRQTAPSSPPQPAKQVIAAPPAGAEITSGATDLAELVRGWGNVVAALGQTDKRIQALLRDCHPIDIDGDIVVLGFFYQFHKTAIEEQAKREVVEKVLSEVRKTPTRVRCVFSPKEKAAARSPVDDPLVKAAVSMGARIRKVEVDPEGEKRA
ncbi:MAG: DNA polymerase III subunit gamma/tau [Chloroflexi bacterium]|nr:DNA polymerase III subunit gamma/tau [Chloroflexota bacterium]